MRTENHAQSSTPARNKQPSRVMRWGRRFGLLIAALCIVIGAGLWIVTRSTFIIARVQPELEKLLGGDVTIRHASYVGNGQFVIKGISLRARECPDIAAEILQIAQLDLTTDLNSWNTGSPLITEVRVDGAHLRIMENQDEFGRFNFMKLTPEYADDDADEDDLPQLPPRVHVHNAVIETGFFRATTHGRWESELGGARRFNGELRPIDDRTITFELAEVDQSGNELGKEGMHIRGNWDVHTNDFESSLDGLHFDDRTYRMSPMIVRTWWDRMSLRGSVSESRIDWSNGQEPVLRCTVDNVELTIPVESEGFWVRYRDGEIESSTARQRLHVYSGEIVLRRDSAELKNLRGELRSDQTDDQSMVGVPYVVNMEIPKLPDLAVESREQWLDEVLQVTAFTLNFRLDDFSVASTNQRQVLAVDLPRIVGEAMERFQMREWVLQTEVDIWRDEPIVHEDGTAEPQPILSAGQAMVRNARCRFDRFPYPLSDVSAIIRFDNDSIEVIRLSGKSSNGQSIRLSGRVAPVGINAGIDLTLTGSSIAIDDVLRDALPENSQRVFDAILNREEYERLASEGALIDDQDIEALRTERRQLIEAIGQLQAPASSMQNDPEHQSNHEIAAQELVHLRSELQRLTRLIDAGPFELGGAVDLNLTIRRDIGRGKPTRVEGEVIIDRVGIVYEHFPYPVTLQAGTLDWQHDRISILGEAGAIQFVTPGGGSGQISGAIAIDHHDGVATVRPDLLLAVGEDVVGPSLFSALRRERDSAVQMADILGSLNLEASIDYAGHIQRSADADVDYQFEVVMSGGRAAPDADLIEQLGMSGLHWPSELTLENISAALAVTPQGVRVDAAAAEYGSGRITAQGLIAAPTEAHATQMVLHFSDMAIEEYLVELAPESGKERAREIWDRYQPTGTFDASVEYVSDSANETHSPPLTFQPREVVVQIDGAPLTLHRESGSIHVQSGRVAFDDLQLALTFQDRNDGVLTLSGEYGTEEQEADLLVRGHWRDGRLESPLVTEVMHIIDADDLAHRYAGYEPSGAFSAEFSYESPMIDRPRNYEINIRPETIAISLNEVPVRASLDPDAQLRLRPGTIEFVDAQGIIGSNAFTLRGSAHFDSDWTDAQLYLEFDGRMSDEQVLALLPEAVRDALRTIELREEANSRLTDGFLGINRTMQTDADGGESLGMNVDFDGILTLHDATLHAGVDFENISGQFDVSFRRHDGSTASQVNALLDQVLIFGRKITNAEATIELAPDTSVLHIAGARGDLYGGMVTADARVGFGEDSSYVLDLDLAGVGLGGFEQDHRDEMRSEHQPENNRTADYAKAGQVYGQLAMSGTYGQDRPDRQGRGSVRIIEGQMARMPIALRLVQLLELMPPLSESFNYADARFYVDDDRFVFEHILLESATLQLVGRGDMMFDTMEIDWLLRSRGTLSVIREVVGGVSDALFGIRITGTLQNPSAELVALPGLAETEKRSAGGPSRVLVGAEAAP